MITINIPAMIHTTMAGKKTRTRASKKNGKNIKNNCKQKSKKKSKKKKKNYQTQIKNTRAGIL